MSEHRATIDWSRTSSDFTYNTYNRDHTWRFGSGQSLGASAAPGYKGNPDLVDPEEAFVASLSACHMLTFLALAAKRGFTVDRYVDEAVGHLAKGSDGKLAIARVELSPEIAFQGTAPTPDELEQLHHAAHGHCFIANSVRTEVAVVAARV
ncbi:MAG: OsmC family protein [Phycisphaerales bacterium]|nr:OsmC family protein [Phycisphaerales bacterium]